MKNARLVLIAASILVLALAASAVGAPKPEFKAKVGKYTGTATNSAGTAEVTGQVAKEGKKYIVQALVGGIEVCSDGTHLNAAVGIPATINGKSFSATESGKDGFTGGTATYKISGSFSNEKTFSGTASKESTAGPLRPEVGICKTGPIKFTLHLKG